MSKLPEKAVLDGSKIPKTTTGEMKEALGEDSGDKESARLANSFMDTAAGHTKASIVNG